MLSLKKIYMLKLGNPPSHSTPSGLLLVVVLDKVRVKLIEF
jgi:hypothetical protein